MIFKHFEQVNFIKPSFQFSVVGPFLNCSTGKSLTNKINWMDGHINCGMDRMYELAILKALSEYIERAVMKSFFALNPHLDKCDSDGFAAYPKIVSFNAEKYARQNALAEAIERYGWFHWWEDHNIEHNCQDITSQLLPQMHLNGLELEKYPIESILLIRPSISASKNKLYLLFAKIRNFGFISGGSAGVPSGALIDKAFVELCRHYLAATVLLEEPNRKNMDAYNARLHYFASGEGNSLVENRLSAGGTASINLPPLAYDQKIDGAFFNSIYYVHRCAFQNQPVFVDHTIDRFCL